MSIINGDFMSHYDDMIMDLMHISKREYDLLTQRNSDLEIHTDCLIKENSELKRNINKLREDNVVLREEVDELNEIIRNKNTELDSLVDKIKKLEQSIKHYKEFQNIDAFTLNTMDDKIDSLQDEIRELYEVIRNKNNEIKELKDSVRIVVDFKCGDDDE